MSRPKHDASLRVKVWRAGGFSATLLTAALFAAVAQPSQDRAAIPLFRWHPPLFRWQYNPAQAPSWLSANDAWTMVERAVNGWQAACGVEIRYEGVTDGSPGAMDGINVIGWDPNLPTAQRGITTGRTRRDGTIIERDIAASPEREEFRRFPRLMEKVIAHEIGHALGLVHAQGCEDLMSFGGSCRQIPPDRLPVVPTPGDVAACRARYDVKPP